MVAGEIVRVVVLDVGGAARSSEEFSCALSDLMVSGTSHVAFVIGGAGNDGLGGGAGVWTSNGKLSVAAICHDQGHRPFVVFNTTGVDRSETVDVIVWDNAPHVSGKHLRTFDRTYSRLCEW